MTEEDTDENVNERINPVSSKPEDVEEIEKIGDRTESVQSNEEIVTEEPWISSILFFFYLWKSFFFLVYACVWCLWEKCGWCRLIKLKCWTSSDFCLLSFTFLVLFIYTGNYIVTTRILTQLRGGPSSFFTSNNKKGVLMEFTSPDIPSSWSCRLSCLYG